MENNRIIPGMKLLLQRIDAVKFCFTNNPVKHSRNVWGYSTLDPSNGPIEMTVESFVGDSLISRHGALYPLRPDEEHDSFYIIVGEK